MRNSDSWQPTKYRIRRGKLHASSDRRRLGVSSRLNAQLVADAYGKYIPVYCRGDLADIGCGFAPMYEYYNPYVSSVTTIDWAESYHANEHLDIIADLNTAPIPEIADQSYDTVVMSDVLEHIYNPLVLLGELYRIMRPGATLLMNVPFFYRIHEAPHDYHRYTEFALKRYLEDSGFEVIEIQSLGGIGSCTIDFLSKGLCMMGVKTGVKMSRAEYMLRMLVRLPCHLAVTVLQNAACLLRNAPLFHSWMQAKNGLFPLGYFVIAKKVKGRSSS